jgi:glycosyltransferase involved in cell wall biosynthesis
MRVAFVSMWTAQLRETGATRRLRRTAELLADHGHDVHVCCSQWWEGHIESFEQESVTYHAVTEGPATGSFASKVPFALRRVKPDVIQAVNTPPAQVRAAAVAGRLIRTPVLADWWCDDPDVQSDAYDRAARAPDGVVTPSRYVKTTVREHGGDEESVWVIPESVDCSLVREAPVDDRTDVVYARELDADANVESLLLALAELRGRDWRATVVGDGPERPYAEQTARDLRIDDRVEFLGEVPTDELVSILRGAHVYAQTATREPFATGLLWGLAAGCIGLVEYQARSSAHELVEGRERGHLVTDPQELADAIVDAADEERRTYDDTYESFDHSAIVDQYVDCYRSLVDDYGLF